MDLNEARAITIPEGNVIMIMDSRGIILWPPGSIQPTGGYVYTQDGSIATIISATSDYYTQSNNIVTFR